jgi:double-stranded uracil-DNA glycosylase
VTTPWRPTKDQLAAARDAVVPDIIAPDLDVLFCGINPGLYSGAVGHHFARPGNRFWKALYAAGFTDRVLSPFDEAELLDVGLGITNLVERATATADELASDELKRGALRLRRKAARLRPRWVAFLGLTAYRVAFGQARASVGPQAHTLSRSRVWLLPNPSGLNAHYQVPDLARVFGELRAEAQSSVETYSFDAELGVRYERHEYRRRPRRARR